MKASTLVLILCIGLMCFTGFGSTTADLTDNSTTEMAQSDLEISVIVVTAEFAVVVLQDEAGTEGAFAPGSEKVNVALFHSNGTADLLFQENAIELEQHRESATYLSFYNQAKATLFLRTPDIPEGDVGWQVLKINYPITTFDTNGLTRNPRDGLRYSFHV